MIVLTKKFQELSKHNGIGRPINGFLVSACVAICM